MATEKEQTLNAIREKAVHDSQILAPKQRFALFSQPLTLAIGQSSSYGIQKLHPRDQQGKPQTQPRNIVVSAPQSGQVKKSYFSVLGFTTIGDQYIDIQRQNRLYELSKQVKSEYVFQPASGYKSIIQAPYGHLADMDHSKQQNYRGPDGKVISAPPNINTNPYSQLLFQFPKYMDGDKYDAMKILRKNEIDAHHKQLGEQSAFLTTHHGNRVFNKDQLVFGTDVKIEDKPQKETKLNIFPHDAPFQPSNPPQSGYKGFLNPFPPYKQNPPKEVKRRNLVKDKDPFKPNNGGNLSRPTPTVSLHPINIRREMGSISSQL